MVFLSTRRGRDEHAVPTFERDARCELERIQVEGQVSTEHLNPRVSSTFARRGETICGAPARESCGGRATRIVGQAVRALGEDAVTRHHAIVATASR
jgi:hypothetical protein